MIQLVSNSDSVIHESLLIEGLNCVERISKSEEVNTPSVLIIDKQINPDDWRQVFSRLLTAGKTIIFPRHGNDLEECFGIKSHGSSANGYLFNKRLVDFQDAKLQVFDISWYQDGDAIMNIEDTQGQSKGYQGIAEKKIGQGNLIFYAFNLSKTIFHLTHGRDIHFREHVEGVMRTDMGIVCEEEKFQIPQVDILRRILVRLIEDHCEVPLPRLWYFPFSHSTGLCVTHDSDNATEEDIEKINRVDKENAVPSTTFMSIFNASPNSWRSFKNLGLDLQYHHVHLYFYHAQGLVKKIQRILGDFYLFKKVQYLFFCVQKKILEKVSLKKIEGNRNHGLAWNSHFDQSAWFEKKNFNLTVRLDPITSTASCLAQAPLIFFENQRPLGTGIFLNSLFT